MTMRAAAGVATDMMQILGADPVVMGPGDIYENVSKGVINGAVFEWSGLGAFKIPEVLKCYTEINITCNPFYTIMNIDAWNALPAEYQAAIDEIWGAPEVSTEFAGIFQDSFDTAREDAIANYGAQIVEVSEADLAEFKAAAEEYSNSWI
jgi:TRAP-type C4-dicarboxylate transport system substrate-binding protein